MKLKLLIAAGALVACSGAWAEMSDEDYFAVLSPEEYEFYHDAGICESAYHHAGMLANNTYIRDEIRRQGLAVSSAARAWAMSEAYNQGILNHTFVTRDVPLGEELRDDSVRTILTYNCQKYLRD